MKHGDIVGCNLKCNKSGCNMTNRIEVNIQTGMIWKLCDHLEIGWGRKLTKNDIIKNTTYQESLAFD